MIKYEKIWCTLLLKKIYSTGEQHPNFKRFVTNLGNIDTNYNPSKNREYVLIEPFLEGTNSTQIRNICQQSLYQNLPMNVHFVYVFGGYTGYTKQTHLPTITVAKPTN